MKACANLEKGPDPPMYLRIAGGRLGNSGKDFQQCALACAVRADYPHHLTSLNLQRHILQRPDRLRLARPFPLRPGGTKDRARPAEGCEGGVGQRLAQGRVALLLAPYAVSLGETLYAECNVTHGLAYN